MIFPGLQDNLAIIAPCRQTGLRGAHNVDEGQSV
jgi:hypothetical protein